MNSNHPSHHCGWRLRAHPSQVPTVVGDASHVLYRRRSHQGPGLELSKIWQERKKRFSLCFPDHLQSPQLSPLSSEFHPRVLSLCTHSVGLMGTAVILCDRPFLDRLTESRGMQALICSPHVLELLPATPGRPDYVHPVQAPAARPWDTHCHCWAMATGLIVVTSLSADVILPTGTHCILTRLPPTLLPCLLIHFFIFFLYYLCRYTRRGLASHTALAGFSHN